MGKSTNTQEQDNNQQSSQIDESSEAQNPITDDTHLTNTLPAAGQNDPTQDYEDMVKAAIINTASEWCEETENDYNALAFAIVMELAEYYTPELFPIDPIKRDSIPTLYNIINDMLTQRKISLGGKDFPDNFSDSAQIFLEGIIDATDTRKLLSDPLFEIEKQDIDICYHCLGELYEVLKMGEDLIQNYQQV